MKEKKQSRRVSSKKLRALLAELANDICGVQDKVQQKTDGKICSSGKMHYICSAYLLRQATESPIHMPAAFFMPLAVFDTSSVPCGALMRPQPVSGGKQRGAELFSYPCITPIY